MEVTLMVLFLLCVLESNSPASDCEMGSSRLLRL